MTGARRQIIPLAVTAALVFGALSVAGAAASAEEHDDRAPYALLQMNLCLSGLAGCYAGTEYPAVVDEAIAKIREMQPGAVTVNEACSGDVERIARETGYHQRFATVIYRGAPLPCRNPEGRGVFGNAVLTRDAITASEDRAFQAQLGAEERRWLCVRTVDAVRACTAHLSVAGSAEQRATNDAQCEELAEVLATDDRREATIFGGDVNRRASCAPPGAWTERDEEAEQAPGIQHVYGSRPAFVEPEDAILPMSYSDHDALLVRAQLLG